MKIKAVKGTVNAMLQKLETVIKLEASTVFSYAIAKNKGVLESIIKQIRNERPNPSEKYIEFNNKRIDIIKELATKDAKGNPVIKPDGNYDLPDMSLFDKQFDPLKEEYKETVDEFEEKEKAYFQSMTNEMEIDIHKIQMEYVPKIITPEQMESILPFVEVPK